MIEDVDTRVFSYILIFLFFLRTPVGGMEPVFFVTYYEQDDYKRDYHLRATDEQTRKPFLFVPGLDIIGDVENIVITIDGNKVGQTPYETESIDPGSYLIKLEKSGFDIIEARVLVKNGKRTVLTVNFQNQKTNLKLKELPQGARIYIDNRRVEPENIVLSSGEHILRIESFGKKPVKETLLAVSGENISYRYTSSEIPFRVKEIKSILSVVSLEDIHGIPLHWKVSAPGKGTLLIMNSLDTQTVLKTVPLEFNSSQGTFLWKMQTQNLNLFPDGTYIAILKGTGKDGTVSAQTSSFKMDRRFVRTPVLGSAPLPGLLYAPGAAMLPPGGWQVSTSISLSTNYKGNSVAEIKERGVPFLINLRFSPLARLELGTGFNLSFRDSYNTNSMGFSLWGAWRITRKNNPLKINIGMRLAHEGYLTSFGKSPSQRGIISTPSVYASIPMEYTAGTWSFILAPSLLFHSMGSLLSPRLRGAVSIGTKREGYQWMIGLSIKAESPDFLQVSASEEKWIFRAGLESRLNFPSIRSHLAIFTGLRISQETTPVQISGLEFGFIR